jgi:hypothetical protein
LIELTVFEKHGGILSKRISLDAQGALHSDGSECRMARGTARRLSVDSATAFGGIIERLPQNAALALGALRDGLPEWVHVATKARIAKLAKPPTNGPICRTRENISFRPGQPAWALLDVDTKSMPSTATERIGAAGGIWQALVNVLPALNQITRVTRASTSSGLYRLDTDEHLPGSQNWHIYVWVTDGADIERCLEALHARCWLAGLGWYVVGSAGQLLERSIIDVSVGASERLVFEGPPIVVAPLAQDQAARKPIVFEGVPLDTCAACPPLTVAEATELERLKADARRKQEKPAAKAREAYIAAHAQEMAERTGMAQEQAARIIASQCGGVLLPDVVLPFDDDDLEGKTVGDVLANPAQFEGATLADPLDGPDHGRGKAKVLLRSDGTPWIKSFAHGGINYALKYDARAIDDAIDNAEPETVATVFVTMALNAVLTPVELKLLLNRVAKCCGCGIIPIKAMVKEALREQKRRKAEEAKARKEAARRAKGSAGTDDTFDTDLDVVAEIAKLGPDPAIPLLVRILNRKYAVVNYAGKTVIISAVREHVLARDYYVITKPADFRQLFQNRKVTIPTTDDKTITRTYAELWLEDEERREYLDGIVFDPRDKAYPRTLNLWRGFAVKPKKGDWSLMKEHIKNVICGGDDQIYTYVKKWLAHMVQKPWLRAEVVIVLRGEKGTGKGILGRWIIRLCGQHGLHIFNPVHLVGRFNVHLRDAIFLFADEAFFAGDKQHEGILKGLVTEAEFLIEEKFYTPVMTRNRLHILMSSNSDWVVPATPGERRYLVLDVASSKQGDAAYFKALNEQMEQGGLEAMLEELLNMKLGDFHPRADVPDTNALTEQKQFSLTTLQKWWLAVLTRGFVWRSRHGIKEFLEWQPFAATTFLSRSYQQWCVDNRVNYIESDVALGKFMTKLCSVGKRGKGKQIIYEAETFDQKNPSEAIVKQDRPHGYHLDTLEDARTTFAEKLKFQAKDLPWTDPEVDPDEFHS